MYEYDSSIFGKDRLCCECLMLGIHVQGKTVMMILQFPNGSQGICLIDLLYMEDWTSLGVGKLSELE